MNLFERLTGHRRNERVELQTLLFLLLKRWKTLVKCGIVGLILGVIIYFSLPKEYAVNVVLAPEEYRSTLPQINYSLLFDVLPSSQLSPDAYTKNVYAEILNSQPFLYGLLSAPITLSKDNTETTVDDVLKNRRILRWLPTLEKQAHSQGSSSQAYDVGDQGKKKYTEEELDLMEELRQRIRYVKVERTGGILLEVKMPDPVAAAQLADTVINRFECFFRDYRINKAREVLEYSKNQEQLAKEDWYRLQDSMAQYIDRNQNISSAEAGIISQRLQNEVELASQAYHAAVLDSQKAEVQLNEMKPVFVVVTPPSVPHSPSSLGKLVILSYCVFFSLLAGVIKIFFLNSEKNTIGVHTN